jgi:hypothetical protein
VARYANESFTLSIRESGFGKETPSKTRELRKTLDAGLQTLQKLRQPSSKAGGNEVGRTELSTAEANPGG